MSIWLFRAGKSGEYEEKFLNDNRIYLTWQNLDVDLKQYKDRTAHLQKLQEMYPTEKINTLRNWESTDIIKELFANYDKLSPVTRAEIPLKQIWILSETNDETEL